MIKRITRINVSDLNRLGIIFDDYEIKSYGIIEGDKLDLSDMFLVEKEVKNGKNN